MLKRWFDSLFFKAGVKQLKKVKSWGDNEDTLEYLTDSLEKVSFANSPLIAREAIMLATVLPNIDVLLQELRRVVYLIDNLEPLKVDASTLIRETRSLDRFLIDNNNLPVHPQLAAKTLVADTRQYLTTIGLLISEEHPKVGYYQRMGALYVADLRVVLEAFCLLANLKVPNPVGE